MKIVTFRFADYIEVDFDTFQVTDVQQNTWCTPPVPILNPNLIVADIVDDEIETEETSIDLSAEMVSGKYVFSVIAVAEYKRTMLSNGKVATFRKISDPVTLDRENAVQVVEDLYAEPIDDSIPFESLVKEDDEQGNAILKILKKIKEVFMILLRFVSYAGDKTGISEEIRNKKG